MDDFSGALERIVLGAERKVMLTGADRRPTAYHEAGHALVGMLTPGADPVRKVSIIPRTMSLGVTMSAPESDRFNYDTRARGGGGRVRRRDHRRRERHPSGDAARAQHGRPVGMRNEVGSSPSCPRTEAGGGRTPRRRSPSGRGSASMRRSGA
jgi:hypothetical protein